MNAIVNAIEQSSSQRSNRAPLMQAGTMQAGTMQAGTMQAGTMQAKTMPAATMQTVKMQTAAVQAVAAQNLAASNSQHATQAKAVLPHRGDDTLSFAETGLLFAAFSTLLCSMMLNVIVS